MRCASLSLLLTVLSGCYLSHELPADSGPGFDGGFDGGRDAGFDGGFDGGFDSGFDGGLDAPPFDAGWDATCDGGTEPGRVSDVAVDMLFVVDNSGSMAEEQVQLTEQFPRMVTVLGSGDLDGDGVEDFAPVRSLRVGVVTTDLGVGFRSELCGPGENGEDGVLRDHRGIPRPGCVGTYPRWLEFRPGTDDSLEEFATDFRCVAQVGTHGCGVEQSLESALKALTPSTSDIRFAGDTLGQGDRDNAGFLRDDSILTIVLITDEDDCSIRDTELMDPDSTRYEGDFRCVDYADEALQPVIRYVDGYRRLRRDPNRLVVAAIAGVPVDLVTDPDAIDYEAILADPRMVQVHDPIFPGQLRPSCNVRFRGSAEPPRRLVRAMQALGDQAVVQSICQESFDNALLGVIHRLGRAIRRVECSAD